MSRIYEALQRAEAERQDDKESPRALPDRPVPPLAQHASPPAKTPPPLVEQPLQPVMRQRELDVMEPFTPPASETVPFSRAELGDDLLAAVQQTRWNFSPEHLPALEKRGAPLEQFRSLRSRIREFRASSKLKSVLISSGLPQEGKSFVAANLAVTLALNKNSKVLLIDGDMRRSTLHSYFGCEARIGLADYLAGKAELAAVMQRPSPESTPAAMVAPVLHNLVLMPAGEGGDKAGDLAGSPRFEELLAIVAPHFEWVIIDSSPVIPISDAVSLARFCDGVLLVARSGQTTFPMAQRAQKELKASNVIGYVLNAVSKPPAIESYYGYTGYSSTGD
jgi:capsular exopolysaccharide synthesis family protein